MIFQLQICEKGMVIDMAVNRLLCVLLIIGTGIYASFYGGNISYAFFYLCILIPIISFLYTLYVYKRFKLYQTIGSRIVVKGDWTDYAFTITNEDFITYRNIKVKTPEQEPSFLMISTSTSKLFL